MLRTFFSSSWSLSKVLLTARDFSLSLPCWRLSLTTALSFTILSSLRMMPGKQIGSSSTWEGCQRSWSGELSAERLRGATSRVGGRRSCLSRSPFWGGALLPPVRAGWAQEQTPGSARSSSRMGTGSRGSGGAPSTQKCDSSCAPASQEPPLCPLLCAAFSVLSPVSLSDCRVSASVCPKNESSASSRDGRKCLRVWWTLNVRLSNQPPCLNQYLISLKYVFITASICKLWKIGKRT